MPNRYLAVGPNWSASGTINQGSLDSTTGTLVGEVIPCPGVFPVKISCQANIVSNKTAYIIDGNTAASTVYAGGDRILIFESVTDSTPNVGTRVRALSKDNNRRLLGGFFDQPINVTNPTLSPYASCGNGALMDNVGLSTALSLQKTASKQVLVGGNPIDASDPANYLLHNVSVTSPSRVYSEYALLSNKGNSSPSGQYFFDTGDAGSTTQQMILNLPIRVGAAFNYCRALATDVVLTGTNRLEQPIPISNFATTQLYANYDNSTLTALVKASQRITAFNVTTAGRAQLSLTATATESAGLFNPKKLSLYVPSNAESIHYAGIDSSDQVFLGQFSANTNTNDLTASFFTSSYPEGLTNGEEGKNKAFTRPAFSFNPSYAPNFDGSGARSLYSAAFPTTASVNKFLDVQSTDYGFIFLDAYSKQLHFMFDRHFYARQRFIAGSRNEDPAFIPENKELINKLIKGPPRSVDFIPAKNMDLGVPATPTGVNPEVGSTLSVVRAIIVAGGSGYTNGSTITFSPVSPDTTVVTGTVTVTAGQITQVTLNAISPNVFTNRPNNGVVSGAGSGAIIRLAMSNDSLYANASTTVLSDDSILHGGGGHRAVLGTYNGALIHDGKISIWGSNRWGQMVIPDIIKNQVLVDVAVSIAPMVVSGDPYSNTALETDSIAQYSESQADAYAKQASTFGNYKYHYPRGALQTDVTNVTTKTSKMRYGAHIHYGNLPGHVAVVTSTGRVYCWGNNLYGQCNVPAEISLVSGTTAPTDPVSEVATGAFHTVARTRSGALYVWGAGSPSVGANGYVVNTTSGSVFPAYDNTAGKTVSSSVHFGQSTLSNVLYVPQNFFTTTAPSAYPAANITTLANNSGQKTAAGFSVADPAGQTFKGMIAAGAFHTAVVDSQLKIQCFGAGRVASGQTAMAPRKVTIAASGAEVTQEGIPDQLPIWGRSYSSVRLRGGVANTAGPDLNMPGTTGQDVYDVEPKIGAFAAYPHYAQSLSQYLQPSDANLAYNGTATTLGRFFQNLRFKKVVCGPFTTHGIVYDVQGGTGTFAYSTSFKLSLHSRVVSWGKALTTTNPSDTGFISNNVQTSSGDMRVGPTGVINIIGGPVDANHIWQGGTSTLYTLQDPVGSILGTGCRSYLEPIYNPGGTFSPSPPFDFNITPAAYSLLNRLTVDASEAAWNTNRNNSASANWLNGCPVTLSNFKVKDMAVNGDFAAYIGRVTNLQQSEALITPQANLLATDPSASTFDFESSVFFSGSVMPPGLTANASKDYAHPQRNNPYSGFKLIRRNRVSDPLAGIPDIIYTENTAGKVKNRSLYFGDIRRSTGLNITPIGSNSTALIYYIAPYTIAISEANTVMVVNSDNRPVAWNYGENATQTIFGNVLDLSLLPSVPMRSFKTGRGHIVGVTDGDWPVAKSLASISNTPRLVTELGARLTTTSLQTNQTVPNNVLYSASARYFQPVAIAWGAGDGREHGSNIFLGGFGRHGLQFLDTHAITRYDGLYSADTSGNSTANPLNIYESTAALQWANYYGDYRWHVHTPPLGNSEEIYPTQVAGLGYAEDLDAKLYRGYHEIEAMQSLLFFDATKYALPNAANADRLLFNGTATANTPVAAYRPYFNYRQDDETTISQLGVEYTICCTAPANGVIGVNAAKQNFQQEYYSPLSLTIQNQIDYVTDYSVGNLHSALLFSSKVSSLANVNNGTYRSSIDNFRNMFDVSDAGTPFGNRRVCKLAVVGYGCEGQTAGAERILGDGNIAPVVPRLFARNARVFCGDSFTAVTNPIRIEQLSSAEVPITFTSGQLTVPITVPASSQSSRIRGVDVIIELKATADLPVMDVSGWTVTIPYKGNTWTILGTPKSINTPSSISNLHLTTTYPAGIGVFTSTYRFSDRFNRFSGQNKAYSYGTEGSVDFYHEGGACPSDMSDGNTYRSASTYLSGGLVTLYPIVTNAQHYVLKGNCIPYSTGTGATTSTPAYWNFSDPADPSIPLSLDQGTINLVIQGGITNYSDRTIKVTLEIEVDDGDYPLVIYGNKRSGIWNEGIPGFGPSYTADYTTAFTTSYEGSAIDARETASCPCEQNPIDFPRTARTSFPKNPLFVCGTRKYGPSGNPETVASTTIYSNAFSGSNIDFATSIKAYPVSNFTSVFSRVLHRPFTSNFSLTKNPTLLAFPPAAFISGITPVELANATTTKVTVVSGLNIPSFEGSTIKTIVGPLSVIAKQNIPSADIYDLLTPASNINCTLAATSRLALKLSLGTC